MTEAVNFYIDTICKTNKEYNTFITVEKELAAKKAQAVQKRIDAGEKLSPLAGVPIAVKDNISTIGIETTCASKMLGGYVPVFNATVIDKMQQAGMVVVGKLNMDEFAMGGSCETSYYGPVRNPWNKQYVAGGSSGGSAAAVALGQVPLALGSDTGGSVRQPSGFCGITGIKPTYGSVSRYGAVAFASSLDQIGTMGRDIGDCAALLSVISGPDEKDGTCIIEKPFDFEANSDDKLNGSKIGIPINYFEKGIDEDVKTSVLAAAEELKAAGAQIEEFEMPFMDYAIHAYYIIACAEASSNLSRFDGLKYGYRSLDAKTLSEVYRLSRSEAFGLEVKRRIMLGSFVLSSGYYDAYYKKALQIRSLLKDEFTRLFKRYDAIISPISATTAFKIGENIDDPVKMYMGDIYTVSVNLAGLPGVALPCGFGSNGMPIGFQLIGDAFTEPKLIKAAQIYQNLTTYHSLTPNP